MDVSDLIGIKYTPHGRNKDEGYDCYGLVLEVERRMGHEMKDWMYEEHPVELADEYVPLMNLTETKNISEGVLLEMDYKGELHIGVALNQREFIHATSNGVRINRIGVIPIRKIYKWD